MTLRFTVLASGSGGNTSLVEAGGVGVLIDAGLGPRQLAARLAAVGRSWADVQAVLLTHTHSDHWKDRTLAHLQRRGVPLYCHPGHHPVLQAYSDAYAALHTAGLIRPFAAGEPFALAPGLCCRPLPVRHDGGPTFAFRLDGAPDLFGHAVSLAYAADLGCWDEALADAVADVDLLAVEFNHDVGLERASGRSPRLIARVLGDNGHLSNDQGADLVRAALVRSPAGRLRHLVQLHLSGDCNQPDLARQAAQVVLAELAPTASLHTASQDEAGPPLPLAAASAPSPRRPRRRRAGPPTFVQGWLPGLETEAAEAG